MSESDREFDYFGPMDDPDPDFVASEDGEDEDEEEISDMDEDDYDNDVFDERDFGRIVMPGLVFRIARREPDVDIAALTESISKEQRPQVLERLYQGDFGPMNLSDSRKNQLARPATTASWLQHRKFNRFSRPHLSQRYLPSDAGRAAHFYVDALYSGQFSQDGSLFYNCCKDMKVRVYDTEQDVYNPRQIQSLELNIPPHWTITDGTMSSDNKLIAFSTMCHHATLKSVGSDTVDEVLCFGRGARMFAIYSLEFSPDDRHVVAGCGNNTVRMTDVINTTVSSHIGTHEDDVNCVTFLDDSPNLILSGSDDSRIILWDKRARTGTCAGVFLGHTEGVSGLESRKDGRYIISNGKDQCLKLWDIRNMLSSHEGDKKHGNYTTGFDYRWESYDGPHLPRHPDDCSVMTYGGHSVMRTLIRCHFARDKYIYSGSADGSVYIWHIDGTLIRKLSPSVSLKSHHAMNQNLDDQSHIDPSASYNVSIGTIRDAAWHPTEPVIYASGAVYGGAMGVFMNDEVAGGAMLVMPYAHPQLDMKVNLDYEPPREYVVGL